ncbi:hypothetical protein ACQ4PT_000164 [Festuca glaucescens]
MEKMDTATMPEPEKTTVVFPDWVLVDRSGRIKYYDDGDPVHEDLKKAVGGSTAAVVGVETSSGHSGYFSFTLATPPRLSCLDLYWPKGSSGFPIDTIYSSLLGADKDLLLLRIAIPGCYYQFPQDLFVYTAAGPRPSLMHLPLNTVPAPKVEVFRKFFESKFDIGIMRLAGDQSHYVVADLVVSNGDNKIAQLCVFSTASKIRIPWRAFIKTLPQPSDGGQFPICWLTNTVIPLDGRFLCWVDYYSGLLLSDFSQTNAPVLRFVPFPGEKYTDDVLRSTQTRCCPDRYRSVSVSQGKLRFVHIDNDFYKRNRIDIDDEDTDTDDDEDDTGHENSDPKITIWTLNVAEFKWEIHRKLALDKIWAQPMYKQERIRPGRLPEFPVISVDNPDLVWCLLRQKEFCGKTWMAEVDMEREELRTCTPYVNEQPNCVQDMELKNSFADEPPLPTVFSKYLKNTTEGNVKFATRSSKRARL